MSTRKKPRNFIQRLLKRIWQSFNALIKGVVNGVLRSLMVFKRRSRQSQAGFVLPTVVMVMLVVALLTTAIVIRSFDRAKNASNYRIDEAVINAAKPALDRSRAKIDRLFSVEENRLAGGTPPETGITGSIEDVLNKDEYTFGDETRLKLVTYDNTNAKQQLTSVWKFPVDTDNNGKLDSHIIYGIYFRNPPDSNNDRKPDRPRTPIEARSLPQATGQSDACVSGGGASTEGGGWYETGGQLKKAFFTYVAAVPISQGDITQLPAAEQAKYEVYTGKKGFSALEMQQDQARFALDNNAVWYDDDLEIANVPIFRLNGRIHTNSNLMIANNGTEQDDSIILYQVSSINSCYYKPENGMIIVGGNVVAGNVTGDTNGNQTDAPGNNNLIKIHLYRGNKDNNPNPIFTVANINAGNKTTKENPPAVASNINAYEKRLRILINKGFAKYTGPGTVTTSTFPAEVVTEFASKYDAATTTATEAEAIIKRALENYFGSRLRRVSYKEVPFGTNPFVPYTELTVPDVTLPGFDPPQEWRLIDETYSKIALNVNGTTMELDAIDPEDPDNSAAKVQYYAGDRILVGNALPRQWKDGGNYVEPGTEQDIPGVNWNANPNTGDAGARYRKGLVKPVDDLGDTSRGGFWERAAALSGKEFADPSTKELAGGLRVITGAGIYVDGVAVSAGGTGLRESQGGAVADIRSFLPAPPTVTELKAKQLDTTNGNPNGIKLPKEILTDPTPEAKYTVVWSDTMPMYRWQDSPTVGNPGAYDPGEVLKGDLQMRTTVVYHYNQNGSGDDPKPLACISSYYDPTTSETAQNASNLPQNPSQTTTAKGTSNNGINYPAAYADRVITEAVKKQAYMIFPNGRWVNEPLKKAVDKNGTSLTLDEAAALDAATCALNILKTPTGFTNNTYVPNFAIQERSFLDARQVKALHKRYTDEKGALIAGVTRQTLLTDITDPAKLKIAELGELALAQTPDPGANTPPPYYSLPIEQRQPLEIRVTEIDLGDQINSVTGLRKTSAGTVNGNNEYMLPNSGIIYASRDDALPDITDSEFDYTNQPGTYGNDKGGSATDFKLDPTRHPNGIRLVNGKNLAREDNYRAAEKGLILASNLPVYIKGEFNLHVGTDGTTVREEFEGPGDHLNLPNWNNFYTRDNPDPNFACRPNANNPDETCTNGDRWRPARILADAVTLLSSNFRDGYRTEGDYDINNNAGNLAVEARLKNGFWWNSFATSAEWYDLATNNGPPKDFDTSATATGVQGSSYATNGVTPIQRRVNFREYRMEICRKLPVSACGPADWKLETPPQAPDPENPAVGSGTTAPYSNDPRSISYVPPSDRIYPRRVAFKRTAFGGLIPTADQPVPIAADGSELSYDATGSTKVASLGKVDNALWYFTTTDNTNPAAGISYSNANNLYFPNVYQPEAPTVAVPVVNEKQLLLPGTPDLPQALFPGITLNGATADDPSDFALCTATGSSKSYQPLPPAGGACPAAAATLIEQVRLGWLSGTFPETGDNLAANVHAELLTIPAANTTPVTLIAKDKINIYTVPTGPGSLLTNMRGNYILDRGNQSNPVFVFRTQADSVSLNFVGTTLTLQGVDPNNILWVPTGEVAINDSVPNMLAGTFLGTQARPFRLYANQSPSNLQINGGRILGFSDLQNVPATQVTSLTSTDQPLLIPVLQLHSPAGTPPNQPSNTATERGSAFDGKPINAYSWVQRVNTDKTETYNAVFIMGDSPSRPFSNNPTNLGESGGGLPNFPRFLEAWEVPGESEDTDAITKISGSFIQFRKSSYATAPFESIDDPTQDTSLFFEGANPDYMAQFNFTDNRYQGGGQGRKAPYYRPPLRLWGYDVGLLSQSPDLFSRRFANPTAGTPNEYYREVRRGDPWIETLLCAAEKKGNTYGRAIADPQQLPTNCPQLADYNDPNQQGGNL